MNNNDHFKVAGILDIIGNKDFGLLRPIKHGEQDIYIASSQIKKFNLRTGDMITGLARPPHNNEQYYGLVKVLEINECAPQLLNRPHYTLLTPIHPNQKISLDITNNKANRIIDLFSPIGFGQRALIAAPPKAGKTSLLKKIANSIATNHPEAELFILLIDERPEEVVDIQRSVTATVFSSTFDQLPENHIKTAEFVLERAMRLVELKKDVILLMDSITRLARAYNLVIPTSGRTLSGGFDPSAFYGPKRFFEAARNIEEGGNFTILATALTETGSLMDDVIFEEFKGTGNAEIYLDRKLAEQRIFPAINILRSETRKEELLVPSEQLDLLRNLRRTTNDSSELLTQLLKLLESFSNNDQVIKYINHTLSKRTSSGI